MQFCILNIECAEFQITVIVKYKLREVFNFSIRNCFVHYGVRVADISFAIQPTRSIRGELSQCA